MADKITPIRPRPDQPFSLPHNIEAEQAILGGVLLDNKLLDLCPWLTADDFYEPVHGRIWNACLQNHRAGRIADPISLKTLFETDASLEQLSGPAYLGRLAQAAETLMRAVDYARLVRRLSRLRELHVIASEIAAKTLSDFNAEPVDIWADYAKRVDMLIIDESMPVARTAAQVCNQILHDMQNPKPVWSIGISKLDDSLGGGIREGMVIGFEARPKQFKTGCAHSVLLALAQQKVPAAYLAYEMGAAQVAKRMLGQLGSFNGAMLNKNDDHAIARAAPAMQKFGSLPIAFVDCPGWRFSQLRAVANSLMFTQNVKVFVLDYWQLVARDDPRDNKADFLADVAQWCADQAHEHGTTWIICSQQNRDGHSYASDGLVKACDWHAVLHKHDAPYHLGDRSVETLWMEVGYARDSAGSNIGSETLPVLYIDPNGPHLAQLPGN